MSQSTAIVVGQQVRFPRARSILEVTKVDGDHIYCKNLSNGVDYCNPIHVCDVVLIGQKFAAKDKYGRTASEAAKQTFKVGESAIYSIMGDFWVMVSAIKDNGQVVVTGPGSQVKEFRPSMFSGNWSWHEMNSTGRYHLRGNNGYFHEYSD